MSEQVQELRSRMLVTIAGLAATGLPAPKGIDTFDHSSLYDEDFMALELRMADGATDAVDAWAQHLGAAAALEPTVLTGGGGSWQAYRVVVAPSPWRGWHEVKVWCVRPVAGEGAA